MNFIDKFHLDYEGYTSSHKKLAEYIAENLDEVFILNATQLADRVNVSEATITRFVTKLGFSGYAEFKREIGQLVIKGLSTTEKLKESVESFEGPKSIFHEILEADIKNIRNLAENISQETFDEVINKLSSAGSIYTLGWRTSYTLALYLAFNLRFFLKSVNLIKPDLWDIPEQVTEIGPNDLLIAISFRRYTREVVNIAERIKSKGAYVLGITNSSFSPLAKLANTTLIVKTGIPTYYESYTAPMSLINALITGVVIKKRKEALPALDKLEREFEEFHTYFK